MIKAILFDLDGTLINTNNAIIASFKYTFKKHLNMDIKQEDIVKFFGEPLLLSMERYDKENAVEMTRIYREYNEKVHDELTEDFEGVNETLKELQKRGIILAVVTSKRRKLAEHGMDLFDLKKYFEVIITPEDTEKHKPDGEPALKCCEKLNVIPEEALMVGDSHNDILCGKNAGCQTCLVGYSLLPREELMEYSPDFVAENFSELLNIVTEANKKAI